MVFNVAAFLEGEVEFVEDDIRAVVDAVAHASAGRAIVKVILETGYLTELEVDSASRLAAAAGAVTS
jgi:deoxyribose-phosphate aldolase